MSMELTIPHALLARVQHRARAERMPVEQFMLQAIERALDTVARPVRGATRAAAELGSRHDQPPPDAS